MVERNIRYRFGEIDLLMRDGEVLVFVEVRHRRSSTFGDGAVSVDVRKQRRLIRAASRWLQLHPREAERACRFDVISSNEAGFEWWQDAFRADD